MAVVDMKSLTESSRLGQGRAVAVTGGAGYIGSHIVVQLIEQGWVPIIIDNLSNSSPVSMERIAEITGKPAPIFYKADVRDGARLVEIFRQHSVFAVIHLAGLKSVGESSKKPMLYYQNNVVGSMELIEAMKETGITRFVFSSSATVYGEPSVLPITEACDVGKTTNPYGRSKFIVEGILQDLAVAHPNWSIVTLRYFNPTGAHPSGLIGEDPADIPNNLMPFVAQVAGGRLRQVSVFGDDYPTVDGTGVRDYIHVVDLASGHLAALKKISELRGCNVFNLGTGRGYSVLEMIQATSQEVGFHIPYKVTARRQGDVAEVYADPSRAKELLGWEAELGLHEMIRDMWKWTRMNPNGYR